MRLSPFARLDRVIAPAPAPGRAAFLFDRPFAHRGLHGGSVVENSRSAFQAAIHQGFGIECDVQASRDGEAFVFHDYDLDRLTPMTGPLDGRDAAQLDSIRLHGDAGAMLRLPDMLGLVAERTPLLIEVKARDRQVVPLCLSVRRALEGYRGPVAVMSFNPEVSRWFADHAPRILRGLVVTEQDRPGLRGEVRRRLALWRSKPDFLAYDIRDLPSRFAAAQRRGGLPVLTWTVRDAAQRETAAIHADQIIFENPA